MLSEKDLEKLNKLKIEMEKIEEKYRHIKEQEKSFEKNKEAFLDVFGED